MHEIRAQDQLCVDDKPVEQMIVVADKIRPFDDYDRRQLARPFVE